MADGEKQLRCAVPSRMADGLPRLAMLCPNRSTLLRNTPGDSTRLATMPPRRNQEIRKEMRRIASLTCGPYILADEKGVELFSFCCSKHPLFFLILFSQSPVLIF
jgi:hypothetical protein